MSVTLYSLYVWSNFYKSALYRSNNDTGLDIINESVFLRHNVPCKYNSRRKTRMHSSRMRTVRSSSRLLGGGVCPEGVCPGVVVYPSMHWGRHPPRTEWLTDRCKNITFPQLRLRMVIRMKHIWMFSYLYHITFYMHIHPMSMPHILVDGEYHGLVISLIANIWTENDLKCDKLTKSPGCWSIFPHFSRAVLTAAVLLLFKVT